MAFLGCAGWPGRVAAQPPRLESLLWTSQMQAHLLRSIIRVYGDAVLNFKGVEQDFDSQLNAFDRLARELKPLLQAGPPGAENTTRYFDKLLTRKRTLEKAGKRFLENRKKGHKIGRNDLEPLEKAAFQTVYAARQLLRNLVRRMGLDSLDPENRKRIGEVLLLAEMQGHLLNSIRGAFADNLDCTSSPADDFWLGLSSFDILATVYKSGITGSSPANPEKSRAFRSLISLKHEVLMEGEAMYLVNKTCKQDLEAARTVEGAAGRLMPIFKTLIQEALR